MRINRSNSSDFKNTGDEEILKMVRIVCEVWISLPVAVFGIIVNTTSLVVLLRYRHSSVTTTLLKSITLTDTLILLAGLVLRTMRYLHLPSYDVFLSTWFPWLHPINYFLRVFNVWLTVLLTYERCIAVCYPLHVHFVCTTRRSRLIICTALCMVTLISLPRFFEYKKVSFEVSSTGFEPTDLMTNAYYTVGYRIVFFFVLMYLIPLSSLIVMNLRIVRTLRSSCRRRSVSSTCNSLRGTTEVIPSSRPINDSFSEAARSVTTITVVIGTVSIACNVAVMISHVLYAIELCFSSANRSLIFYRRFSSNLSNAVVTFDSTINFIIYCVFSKRFRVTLKGMCCCWRKNPQANQSINPSYKFY